MNGQVSTQSEPLYYVETGSNKWLAQGTFMVSITLHKSTEISDHIKKSISNLRVGEHVKFSNGLMVKRMQDRSLSSVPKKGDNYGNS
tara:strand:- start:453 stop:713 length:261 start_codon:yes stop_codon:yes gene_type:complete